MEGVVHPRALKRAATFATLSALVPMMGLGVALAQDVAVPAAAQTRVQPEAPARLEELVRMLDSPELSLREIATQSLRDNQLVTLEVLETLLRDGAALSAEQRVRLETLARDKFVRRPRGALGVQFGMLDGSGEGVAVGATIPGFQSAEVLRPGDIIVMMGTTRVRYNDDARAAIISHEPGEVVDVQIKRRGEAMTVSLRLGSFSTLPNAARLDTPTMERAWRIRRERQDVAGRAAAEPVDTGLSVERFGKLALLAQVESERRADEMAKPADPLMPAATPSPGVVAGGEHRRPMPASSFLLNTSGQLSELARIEQEIEQVGRRMRSNDAQARIAPPQDRPTLLMRVESDRVVLRELMRQRDRLLNNLGGAGVRVK